MSDETKSEETQTTETEATTAAAETDTPGEPASAEDSSAEPTAEAAPEESAPEAEQAAADEESAPEAETPTADEEAAPPAEAVADDAPGEATEAEAPAAAEVPAYTYDDLHKMNVAQLREVAATIDHEAVHGYTTMHKEHLVPAICQALGIEAHEHHEVVGIDKAGVKAKIRQLKKERDEAEAAGDAALLKLTRRRIRGLKRKIRKATV